jgi:hypothetical protein
MKLCALKRKLVTRVSSRSTNYWLIGIKFQQECLHWGPPGIIEILAIAKHIDTKNILTTEYFNKIQNKCNSKD